MNEWMMTSLVFSPSSPFVLSVRHEVEWHGNWWALLDREWNSMKVQSQSTFEASGSALLLQLSSENCQTSLWHTQSLMWPWASLLWVISLSPFGSLIKNCPISWRRPNLDPQPPANSLHVHSSDALNALEDLKDLSGTEIWWSTVNHMNLPWLCLHSAFCNYNPLAQANLEFYVADVAFLGSCWPFFLLGICDAEKVCPFFVRLHE